MGAKIQKFFYTLVEMKKRLRSTYRGSCTNVPNTEIIPFGHPPEPKTPRITETHRPDEKAMH